MAGVGAYDKGATGMMFVLSTNKLKNIAFYIMNQATLDRGPGIPYVDGQVRRAVVGLHSSNLTCPPPRTCCSRTPGHVPTPVSGTFWRAAGVLSAGVRMGPMTIFTPL